MVFTKKNSLITLYATIFILIFETLILKVSPQLFSIFNTLPLLVLGLIIELKFFAWSIILSNLFLFSISFSENIFLFSNLNFSNLFFSHLLISILTFLLFSLIKSQQIKEKNLGETFAIFNLLFCIILFLFLFFFYTNTNLEKIGVYLTNVLSGLFENLQNNDKSKIQEIVYKILPFLPSINFFLIEATTIINLFFAKLLISKSTFQNIYNINLENFTIPKWYFFFFISILIFSSYFHTDIKLYFQNFLIISTFIYVMDGFICSWNFLKQFKTNTYIKLLIIFLLFIFLGYLLILFIFILGFYRNFKFVINKN